MINAIYYEEKKKNKYQKLILNKILKNVKIKIIKYFHLKNNNDNNPDICCDEKKEK